MMHIEPAIPEWKELEEYLNERDKQHGHEVALTDYGLICTAMDIGGVKKLWLVKWHKTDWRDFDWDDLPEDLQQTLRALAYPNANDWIYPDEDFPNIVSLNIVEPTLEKSIESMKQALRLLDYGWILAEPRYAPCIWGEKEWDDTPASIDVKEDLEWYYPEGYFLFQRIVNGEKLPAKIDWTPMTQNSPYADIIHLPHHVSQNHPQMPMLDRAAQFAPFAALTGYEAAVGETARLTAERRELDAQEAEELNRRLAALIANLPDRPEATIEYFVPDDRKSGGAYVTVTGRVRHISVPEKTLVMEDGTVIGFEDIAAISGFQFEI